MKWSLVRNQLAAATPCKRVLSRERTENVRTDASAGAQRWIEGPPEMRPEGET